MRFRRGSRESPFRQRSRARRLTTVLVFLLAAGLTAALTVLAFRHSRAQALGCDPLKERVAIIGDSYTSGAGTDSGTDYRYPSLVARRLGVQVEATGYNGSGYVARGPRPFDTTFPEAASEVDPKSSVVLVFGSRNDAASEDTKITPSQIRQAAEQTFETLRATAPKAKIVVVGPPWINADPPPRILKARDSVKKAAETEDLVFVDPLEEGWFSEEIEDGKSRFIAKDHIHPTDAGHSYLADQIAPVVRQQLTCQPDLSPSARGRSS